MLLTVARPFTRSQRNVEHRTTTRDGHEPDTQVTEAAPETVLPP
jgi:hypothetical protein